MFNRVFPPGRRRAALVATAILLVAVVGVVGYLSLTPKPAPDVTVTGFNWTYQQGTIANGTHAGMLWFGQAGLNDSGAQNGFPIQVPSGGTLTVSVYIDNWDNVSHTITKIHLSGGLHVVGSAPALPATIDGSDDATIAVTVSVEASAGATVFGEGTVTAT